MPDIYVDKSRDFQLLCRVLSVVENASAFTADVMLTNLDPRYCDTTFLPYLCDRYGFFTNKHIPAKILRNILYNFRRVVKLKGTVKAIREAVRTVLSSYQRVNFVNVDVGDIYDVNYDKYCIHITSDGVCSDITPIEEFLKYVTPAGYYYKLTLGFISQQQYDTTYSFHTDEIHQTRATSKMGAGIINRPEQVFNYDALDAVTKDNFTERDSTNYNELSKSSLIDRAQFSSDTAFIRDANGNILDKDGNIVNNPKIDTATGTFSDGTHQAVFAYTSTINRVRIINHNQTTSSYGGTTPVPPAEIHAIIHPLDQKNSTEGSNE